MKNLFYSFLILTIIASSCNEQQEELGPLQVIPRSNNVLTEKEVERVDLPGLDAILFEYHYNGNGQIIEHLRDGRITHTYEYRNLDRDEVYVYQNLPVGRNRYVLRYENVIRNLQKSYYDDNENLIEFEQNTYNYLNSRLTSGTLIHNYVNSGAQIVYNVYYTTDEFGNMTEKKMVTVDGDTVTSYTIGYDYSQLNPYYNSRIVADEYAFANKKYVMDELYLNCPHMPLFILGKQTIASIIILRQVNSLGHQNDDDFPLSFEARITARNNNAHYIERYHYRND